MNYTIIPELVTIETNRESLKDFLLSQTLSFYPFRKALRNHYQIHFTPRILTPNRYSARFGNYTITDDSIYYHRKLFGNFAFDFSYNVKKKIFYFNSLYKYHFVNIGDIFTLGRHLFHIIEADLAKEGYYIVLGAAISKNNRATILLAPNGNGKTEFVNKSLKRGQGYIAENFVILHPKTKEVFGISPIFQNKGRSTNRVLGDIFRTAKIPIATKQRINNIYLLSQHNGNVDRKEIITNYMDTYSQFYKKNNLVRSLLYIHAKNTHLDSQYMTLKKYLKENTKVIFDIESIQL